jgi:hypothetical protein
MIRPISKAEMKAMEGMSIKDRVTKWKTFVQCCYGAGIRPTRREVKQFASETGRAWEFYKEAIS